MTCTEKQAKLIQDLQTAGAPIPENAGQSGPDNSMFDSVANADAYIKAHYHFLYPEGRVSRSRAAAKESRADDWGGVWNT